MNKNAKKVAFLVWGLFLMVGTSIAAPHHGFGRHSHRPPPMHHSWHHPPYHCYGGFGWPRGRFYWPWFVGGMMSGMSVERDVAVVRPAAAVVTTPTVVQQPVVIQQPSVVQPTVVQQTIPKTQNVWVEGRYVEQVQPNGSTARVWQPGHYERQMNP